MIDYLLSIANHHAFTVPVNQSLLIECLYSKQHNKNRTFKHSLQSLISSLVDSGHFDLAAGLLNLLTSNSIKTQFKQHSVPASNVSTFPSKLLQSEPISENLPFQYIPNKLLRLNSDFAYYKNSDLAALIFITLFHHPTITRKDLERLSQKYISLFPSLHNSDAWDSRYSSGRSRFNILSSEVLRSSSKYSLIESVKVDGKTVFALTDLGLSLCELIFNSLPTNLNLVAQ